MTTPQLREIYSGMRDIFQKRVKRMSAAGVSKAQSYLKGEVGYIPTLKERTMRPTYGNLTDVERRRALELEVLNLANLVGASGRNETGQISLRARHEAARERNKMISDTLNEHGFRISKSQVPKFGRFMDEMRKLYGPKLPNSEQMAEFFGGLKYNAKRKSLSFIVDLWKEYVDNGYKLPDDAEDLFSPGDLYKLLS